MSLINQLLKDLASRQHSCSGHAMQMDQHGRAVLSRLAHLRFPQFIQKKMVMIFIALLFFFLIVIWHFKHMPILKMVPPLHYAYSQSEIKTSIQLPLLSRMYEARVFQDNSIIKVLIPFDRLPLYRLDAYPDQQRLSIYFDRTHIPDTFKPIIDYPGELRGVNYVQMGQDARIDLDMTAKLQLKNIIQKDNMLEFQLLQTQGPSNNGSQEKMTVKQYTQESLLQRRYEEAIQKIQIGDLQLAERELFSIVETSPQFLAARVALIALALERHEEPAAQRLIGRGLELSPHAPDLLSLQAEIFIQHQKIDEALKILTSETPSLINAT